METGHKNLRKVEKVENLKIVQFPDEILSKKCAEFEKRFEGDFYKILLPAAKQMADYVYRTNNCVALAAPQIGMQERFFVMCCGYTQNNMRFCFNPSIIDHGQQIEVKPEGCMSWENGTQFVQVPRWRIITVIYRDEHFNLQKMSLRGKEARIYQHEMDHLNGLMIIKENEGDIDNGIETQQVPQV